MSSLCSYMLEYFENLNKQTEMLVIKQMFVCCWVFCLVVCFIVFVVFCCFFIVYSLFVPCCLLKNACFLLIWNKFIVLRLGKCWDDFCSGFVGISHIFLKCCSSIASILVTIPFKINTLATHHIISLYIVRKCLVNKINAAW